MFCESAPPVSPKGVLKVLLICRRDSLAFIEFVRGKYSTADPVYLTALFNGMTIAEQDRIRTLRFDGLWKSLWGTAAHTHKADYDNSIRKYHQLDILKLLGENPTTWTEPEWGFPKGRKNINETDLQCAMREFYEETNLARHTYSLLQNMKPIVESFVGSNDVSYCHKYAVAMCEPNQAVALTPLNHDMCREIGQIGWFTIEEAIAKLRPENTTKRDILRRIEQLMRTVCVVNL